MYQQYAANGGHSNMDASDPFEVRQHYRNELATLTFNSKPIITSLTIAAGENVPVSKVIVQTIEERIRTAPASQKLPTLYLIDSIIKNVGGPYLNLFSRSIVNLFLDAYQAVDNTAKISFEKVLGTWPNWNTQLFSRDIISRIERGVHSMRQQRHPPPQQQQQPSMHVNPHFSDRPHDGSHNQGHTHGQGRMFGVNGSTAPQNRIPQALLEARPDNVLLQDIQLLMLQKQQESMINPNDEASAKQVAILQQLEQHVKSTQVTPEIVNMIRQQLAQLWTPPPALPVIPGFPQPGMPMVSSPMPPNMMMPPQPMHLPQQPGSSALPIIPTPQLPPFPGMPPVHFVPPHMPPSSQPVMGSLPPSSMPIIPGNLPPLPMSRAMGSPTVVPAAVASPVPPSLPAPVVPPAASDLFASLMQSGLLGPNGSLPNQLLQGVANVNRASPSPLIGAGLPVVPAVATPPLPSNTSMDRSSQSEQDQSVMSLGMIELTSQDIQRRRPTAVQVMYGTPPLQCNQCGYRCPRSVDAQKKMDAHLDWHFRQNRRMKDKAKRSHSRSWLVGEEDWIHSREGDLSQSQQPVFFDFGSGVSKTSKDELALQEEINALKEQIVSEAFLVERLRANETETLTAAAAMNIIAKGCSICKEKFIKVWNENEEEWSYKNAIVVDGMIYHATCHADLLRSNQRQAALAEAAVAAVAAAAAAATAASEATSSEFTPSSANGEHLLSEPHTRADQKSLQGIKLDQEMSTPDSDSPHSLKRKIEQDEQEQEQASSKKTILAQDV